MNLEETSVYISTILSGQLLHVSHQKIPDLLTLDKDDVNKGLCGKPNGLWLAYDINWIAWQGDPYIPEYVYHFKLKDNPFVNLSDERSTNCKNKILNIRPHELYLFAEMYKNTQPKLPYELFDKIAWNQVAANYAGVNFVDYDKFYKKAGQQNSKFLFKHIWYSGIDISSMCIWNMDAIEQYNLIITQRSDNKQIFDKM
jgi:hypothetical protein